MKKLTPGFAGRLLVLVLFLMSSVLISGQTGTKYVVKTIFPRNQTYEYQMLKTLNFNPMNAPIAYDQVKTWASLSPLEKQFGELSLQAAEILAMDLKPGYTAQQLIDDIGRIPEFKGRLNGILSVLVMATVRKSSNFETNPNVIMLTAWTTQLYKSMRIRSTYSVLREFQKWKADWCTYEKVSREECAAKTNGIGELFSHRDVPEALIAKNGMGSVFDKSANGIAMGTAFAITGVTGTFAVGTLMGALGVTTTITAGSSAGLPIATSLCAAFGAKLVGASDAAVAFSAAGGWAGVAAAPIAATIMAIVVGTIQGFHEVEQAKIEPMMKMKLGAAISDFVNIRNVLSDSSGRSLFFLAFQEAAQDKYQVHNPLVDGELRFFCQAGYVTKFKVTYTVTTSGPNMPTSTKNFDVDTKPLSVGNEEYMSIPWNATNIVVKGYYALGSWQQFTNPDKSALSTSIKTPTYMCFTSYGTIFEPKIKLDCPEAGNMTTRANELTVTQGGGYAAWITLRYFLNGKEETLLNQHDVLLGWSKKFTFPAGAKNITLSIQNQIDAKVVFNQTWPEPPNGCVKIYGTTFEPKWNNECN